MKRTAVRIDNNPPWSRSDATRIKTDEGRMTPTYDLAPGVGVGPFRLGDSLWAVLELLRTHKTEYPKVQVSWDNTQPHKSAITIHLPHVVLYFPAPTAGVRTQALSRILLPNISSEGSLRPGSNSGHKASPSAAPAGCILTYEGDTHVLASPSQPLTLGVVRRVLGPTYERTEGGGRVVYPGVEFDVGAPGQHVQDGVKRGSEREARVRGVVVLPREGEEVLGGVVRACRVLPGEGVVLDLAEGEPLAIRLGKTTAQDVLLDLGPPLRRYWKEDERMAKMWGRVGDDEDGGDCFWNYFQHGIDLLVSRSGEIKRIIVYSNIPGTPLFQRYAKCPWTLSTPSGDLDSGSPASAFSAALGSPDGSRSASVSASTSESPVPPLGAEQEQSPPSSALLAVPIGTDGAGAGSGSSPGGSKKSKKRGSSAGSATSNKAAAPAHGPGASAGSDARDPAVESAETRRASSAGAHRGSGGGDGDGDGEAQRGMLLDRIGEGGLDGVEGDMASRLVGYQGCVLEEDLASGGIVSVLVYESQPGSASA